MLDKQCRFCKELYGEKDKSPLDEICNKCYLLVRECTQGGLKMRDG